MKNDVKLIIDGKEVEGKIYSFTPEINPITKQEFFLVNLQIAIREEDFIELQK